MGYAYCWSGSHLQLVVVLALWGAAPLKLVLHFGIPLDNYAAGLQALESRT